VTNIRISAHFTHLLNFRNFVFATEVTIFSDHNPLVYLRECAPKSAKVTRWALGLQEFMHADSNIFHRAVSKLSKLGIAVCRFWQLTATGAHMRSRVCL